MIHYQIQPIDPLAHRFAVTLRLSQAKDKQQFTLPAWLPGSYMIRDFARHLIGVRAQRPTGEPLSLTQLDKQTWQLDDATGEVELHYQVYAWDLSVRGAHLDQTHGFFNGSSTFLAVVGQEHKPAKVTLLAPEGEQYKAWRVATAMREAGAERYGFGDYEADNYDELIDHPVEMGTFTLATFEAGGVPHDLVLTGRHLADTDRICSDLKKICEYQIELFGGQAPYSRYLFMTQVIGSGFGGLEHRASTALVCGRGDLPSINEPGMSEGYRTFLSLCSHEYFHNWNVKRIKPETFVPYDLSEESYTRQLWAYEGITSYYDDLLVYRSGCVDKETYLQMAAEGMTRVTRGVGRFKQSLRDSSFNAWTKFYKQDENAQNAIVSYYTKGAMFALMLDLTLRIETDGERSLDDLMKMLWEQHGKPGIGTGEHTHQAMMAELLGRDVSDLFAYLDNTDDLPLEALLAKVGVEMRMRAANGNNDKGGKGKPAPKANLGARYRADNFGVRIEAVSEGGNAHRAGLAAGDRLVALNELEVASNLDSQLERYAEGSKLPIHWFRRDELMSGTLELCPAPMDTVVLSPIDGEDNSLWL
ncbi:M61 family metallopeptidase [Ferrimonas balearica]|uniref:M61 family metallopeptidase n=1 Tax=Ferrimonas balearica TaxID=44012 RepID=UPI001C999C67|nr:PDZ domain-containing protein [Ferrimonas balearica]MBY5920722.1 PDZ domain-containing protein [Ferrimonas balearica]MBY5996593.1 PDZ domain-containing protein [Ferrimonas balearica]